MKKTFEDGSVLMTGQDMINAIESLYNHRGNYDRECSFCAHEGDDEYCDECTAITMDGCSCNINAPCEFCVGLKFDVSPFLINYKHYKGGKSRWECFKGGETEYKKLSEIEKSGFNLSCETLTTGEISITIEDSEQDYDIEICNKRDFKSTVLELITRFDLKDSIRIRESLT